MDLKFVWKIIKEASAKAVDDNVPQLAAALAFYTIFSLAPLLIFGTYAAGLIFGPEAGRGELIGQIQNLVGNEAAYLIKKLTAGKRFQAVAPATIIAFTAMFIGATAVFVELHGALNKIWNVKPAAGVIVGIIKPRLLSFVMILGLGFLFLVSLLSTAVIGTVGSILKKFAPGVFYILTNLGTGIISFIIITVLFAMVFKLLTAAKISWRAVWVGAITTSVLFAVGKYLIGFYLTHSGTASIYGAAGSLVVFIFWVYYSAQVFYYGAEITYAYARHHEEADP